MDPFNLLLITVTVLILYFSLEFLLRDRITKYVDKIPGPIKLPIFGTTWPLLFLPKSVMFIVSKDVLRSYGPIMRSWLGREPAIHCIEPENVEIILNNSIQITKSKMYKIVHPWLGDGLLTSAGEKWHKHRKFITPTFHFKILENFVDIFVEKSQKLVEILKVKADGDIFNIYPYITRCTLDIICETAMGVKINALDNPENEYIKSIYGITKLTMKRLTTPLLHPDFIFYKTPFGKEYNKYLTILHNFTTQVIQDRKKAFKNDHLHSLNTSIDEDIGIKKRQAFLDLFIEMSNKENAFTDEEIKEQVDTFMFEGHDTTTAAINWALFLLGNHQDIQDKVYEEVNQVFQNYENLTINSLNDLKLLERCCKEALRLYPSVPAIGRELTRDIVLGGYLVPADCTVAVEILSLHRNPKVYSNPDNFDPDRFLPENTKNRHPYAYVPFSAGPRNCIGQKFAIYEEKIILAYILKNYKITSTQTEETIKPMVELILRPKDGLFIKLEPRV
nr:cytochrome P450 4C1-like [Onthophagus taurus]